MTTAYVNLDCGLLQPWRAQRRITKMCSSTFQVFSMNIATGSSGNLVKMAPAHISYRFASYRFAQAGIRIERTLSQQREGNRINK
jgi:hypothetical protein